MMRFGISELYNRVGMGGFCRGGVLAGHGLIGMIIGGVIFLALVTLFVLLIVKMARRGRMHHPMGPGSYTAAKPETPETSASVAGALALLNERYAKGEINQEEYLAKKADLLK